MTLAQDIETLRELSADMESSDTDEGRGRELLALDRVLELIAPLAALRPEDIARFASHHENNARHCDSVVDAYPGEAPFRLPLAAAHRALAASLTALRRKP